MTPLKFLFISLLLLCSTYAFAAVEVDNSSSALLAKAQQQGSVRVILELDVQFAAEGSLAGAAAVQSQRAAISSTQSTVLSAPTAGVISGVKQFETIPYLAVAADAIALQDLINHPQVIGVQEDALAKPTLLESVPFINGDKFEVQAGQENGTGWTVAILDTGVRKTHIDLDNGKVVSEACYGTTVAANNSISLCPNGNESQTGNGAGVDCSNSIDGCNHGTHVAGIAAGTYGGVAKGADLMAVQVFSRFNSASFCNPGPTPCVLSYSSDQILGLERVLAVHNANNGIKIASANMSLGSGQFFSACDTDPLKAIIDNLRAVNVATVIASGNNGFNGSVSAPSCISSAITVGSTLDNANTISSFSNHAAMVDLLAPGSNITSSITDSNSARASFNGTSMATPHIAGAFAVLRQLQPAAGVASLENSMKSTGVNVSRAGITKPRVNLFAAASTLSGVDLVVESPAVNNATPGSSASITLSAVVRNLGSNQAGISTVRFYRSLDAKISSADTFLGSESVGTLNPNATSNESLGTNVPAAIGAYYYGACVETTEPESNRNNNCSDGVLVVVSNGPIADSFEPDNSAGQATELMQTAMQLHSISPVADIDWWSFTLQNSVNETIFETLSAGFGGDTFIRLYDSGLNQIASDDNSGSASFSRLVSSNLEPGTYYLSVEESGNNAQIEGYFLRAKITDEDNDLLLMIPAIVAGSQSVPPPPPSLPSPQWGAVLNGLCCTVGDLTFLVTVDGVTRSARVPNCSTGSSFAGYIKTNPGNKRISSRIAGESGCNLTFNQISLPFENNFQYLVSGEFNGSPIVRVYRGSLKQNASSAENEQALMNAVNDKANPLAPYKTYQLGDSLTVDGDATGASKLGASKGQIRAAEAE